jgi:hypothetical protein
LLNGKRVNLTNNGAMREVKFTHTSHLTFNYGYALYRQPLRMWFVKSTCNFEISLIHRDDIKGMHYAYWDIAKPA